ncbi:hypothetical protein H4219_006101, partial [Mycoemilia scoparia]
EAILNTFLMANNKDNINSYSGGATSSFSSKLGWGSTSSGLVGKPRMKLFGVGGSGSKKQRPFTEFEVLPSNASRSSFSYISGNIGAGASSSFSTTRTDTMSTAASSVSGTFGASDLSVLSKEEEKEKAGGGQRNTSSINLDYHTPASPKSPGGFGSGGGPGSNCSNSIHESISRGNSTKSYHQPSIYPNLTNDISAFIIEPKESDDVLATSFFEVLEQLNLKSTENFHLEDIMTSIRDETDISSSINNNSTYKDKSTEEFIIAKQMVAQSIGDQLSLNSVMSQDQLKVLKATCQSLDEKIKSAQDGERNQNNLLEGISKIMKLHDQNKAAYQDALTKASDIEQRIHVYEKSIMKSQLQQSEINHQLLMHRIGVLTGTLRSQAKLYNDIEVEYITEREALQNKVSKLEARLEEQQKTSEAKTQELEEKLESQKLGLDYWKSQAQLYMEKTAQANDEIERRGQEVERLEGRLFMSLENENSIKRKLTQSHSILKEVKEEIRSKEEALVNTRTEAAMAKREMEEKIRRALANPDSSSGNPSSSRVSEKLLVPVVEGLRKLVPKVQALKQIQLEHSNTISSTLASTSLSSSEEEDKKESDGIEQAQDTRTTTNKTTNSDNSVTIPGEIHSNLSDDDDDDDGYDNEINRLNQDLANQELTEIQLNIINSLLWSPNSNTFDLKNLPDIIAVIDKTLVFCLKLHSDIINSRQSNTKLSKELEDIRSQHALQKTLSQQKDTEISDLTESIAKVRATESQLDTMLATIAGFLELDPKELKSVINQALSEGQNDKQRTNEILRQNISTDIIVDSSSLGYVAKVNSELMNRINNLEKWLHYRDSEFRYVFMQLQGAEVVLKSVLGKAISVGSRVPQQQDQSQVTATVINNNESGIGGGGGSSSISSGIAGLIRHTSKPSLNTSQQNLVQQQQSSSAAATGGYAYSMKGMTGFFQKLNLSIGGSTTTNEQTSANENSVSSSVTGNPSEIDSQHTPQQQKQQQPQNPLITIASNIITLSNHIKSEISKTKNQLLHDKKTISEAKIQIQLSNTRQNQLLQTLEQEQWKYQSIQREIEQLQGELENAKEMVQTQTLKKEMAERQLTQIRIKAWDEGKETKNNIIDDGRNSRSGGGGGGEAEKEYFGSNNKNNNVQNIVSPKITGRRDVLLDDDALDLDSQKPFGMFAGGGSMSRTSISSDRGRYSISFDML